MKLPSVLTILTFLGVATAATIKSRISVEAPINQQFANFVAKFSRSYKNNDEYLKRLSLFAKNLEIVNNHNANNKDYKLAINKFADLSTKEMETMFGLKSDLGSTYKGN